MKNSPHAPLKNSPGMDGRPQRSFRLVCEPERIPLVEALLHAQGFVLAPEPFYPQARKLVSGPIPLGSSLAAFFGYIYIQDRSSMLPPLALSPSWGAAVLDMCASPGSKTGFLSLLTGPGGFVLGNEPSQKRLATLRRNLQQQNLLNCATCSWPGERLPLPGPAEGWPGWGHIQLDPPCSGWGTAEKNPQALRLWQGDKLKTLISLQRRLLGEAARLLAPGGRLVYSTCTTNVEENENQVRFARDALGLLHLPLRDVPGFSLAPPAWADCQGVWRVNPGQDGQGFFVALLQKPGQARPVAAPHSNPWAPLPRDILDRPGLDTRLLPPGDLALFKNALYFLPLQAPACLPPDFTWKGFPLGRMDKSGQMRGDPFLRSLMPAPEAAAARNFPILNLEDARPALSLLSGQSLTVDVKGPELGLYFRDLPLCRLTVKGRRAMLPPRQG